jgi:signal transduction histidine kinase
LAKGSFLSARQWARSLLGEWRAAVWQPEGHSQADLVLGTFKQFCLGLRAVLALLLAIRCFVGMQAGPPWWMLAMGTASVLGVCFNVRMLFLVASRKSNHANPGWLLADAVLATCVSLFDYSANVGLGYLGVTLAVVFLSGGHRLEAAVGALVTAGLAAQVVLFWQVLDVEVSVSLVNLVGRVLTLSICAVVGAMLRHEIARMREDESRNMASELQRARLSERLEIARALHGDVLKSISMLAILGQELARRQEGGPDGELARQIADGLRTAQAASREVLAGVRRPGGCEFGGACENCFATIAAGYPTLELEYEQDLELIVACLELKPFLCRAFRELMQNTHQHSGATKVYASVFQRGGWLVLRYKDNGIGLAGVDLESKQEEGHFGLAGLREMAEERHGGLRVLPGGAGAAFELRLLISDEEAA